MVDEPTHEKAPWDALALPENVKDAFTQFCVLLRDRTDRRLSMFLPKGVLLCGPPGIDKGRIAQAFANQSGLSVLVAGLSDMKGEFIGQSGQKVQALFERAKRQVPCVLFMDEFDSVAAARGTPKCDGSTDEIVSQWLLEQDGLRPSEKFVFLFVATSYVKYVDMTVRARLRTIEIANPASTSLQ